MKELYVLFTVQNGFKFVDKLGKIVDSDEEAVKFPDKEMGQAFAKTLSFPTYVTTLSAVAQKQSSGKAPAFPVPDYFEGMSPPMSVDTLVSKVRDFENNFTIVNSITGGGQMSGTGLVDPIEGCLVGRKFEFSFNELLSEHDIQDLYALIRAEGNWASYSYTIKRFGCFAYGVLTLIANNK